MALQVMAKKVTSSGTIGENYVICELLRNDFSPLVSPNPSNEDFDVVAIDLKSHALVSMQVKTIRWPAQNSSTKPVITGRFSACFDFLIVVIIGKSQSYEVYVIPRSDLNDAQNGKGGLPKNCEEKISYKNRTIPFSTLANRVVQDIFDAKYKDKWSQVKELLTLRSSGTAQKAAQPA